MTGPAMRAALALLLSAGLAAADERGPTAEGEALSVSAEPVAIATDGLGPGVTLAGAWVLTGEHPAFGGLSGLLVEAGALVAITDRGHWLTARLDPAAERPLGEARIAPMLGAAGRPLAAIDAEALARGPDGALHVAFEGEHRIMRHQGRGRLAEAVGSSSLRGLGRNAGVEALARLPDGSLLAIAEERGAAGFPVWRVRGRSAVPAAPLPAPSEHDVTGADLGPDGRLYVVFRHYSPLTGVSIRLRAYPLGPDGAPDPAGMAELAAFGPASGIDNMEAVAAAPAAGGVTVWLLADDNFNPAQRTVLVALEIGR